MTSAVVSPNKFVTELATEFAIAVKTHCPEGYIDYNEIGEGEFTKTLVNHGIKTDRLIVDSNNEYLNKHFPALKKKKTDIFAPTTAVIRHCTFSTDFMTLNQVISSHQDSIIIGLIIARDQFKKTSDQIEEFFQGLNTIDVLFMNHSQSSTYVVIKSNSRKREREITDDDHEDLLEKVKKRARDKYFQTEFGTKISTNTEQISTNTEQISVLKDKIISLEQSNAYLKKRMNDIYNVIKYDL